MGWSQITQDAHNESMFSYKVFLLRLAHGLFAAYFIACIGVLLYSDVTGRMGVPLIVAVVSLALEGFAVFILNKGDCPLIHIQRKIGDEVPFFELIFPPAMAKRAIPVFAGLTWVAVGVLVVRLAVAIINP